MSQPEPSIDAPAPWNLTGRAYIAVVRMSHDVLDDGRFLPPALHGKRRRGNIAFMMFVDYADSPVGPYHELLFIPGAFPFADGKRHLSISRIFVSSMASVVNGNRNWGIPKDVADFDVRYNQHGVDRITVSQHGKPFARLAFSHFPRRLPLALPVLGALTPASWRTLGQVDHGRHYIYSPSANGLAKFARLDEAWSDAAMFPDLGQARPLLCTYLSHFRMNFPTARIFECPTRQADSAGGTRPASGPLPSERLE